MADETRTGTAGAERMMAFLGILEASGFHRACLSCIAAAIHLTTDDVLAIAELAKDEPDLVVELTRRYACPLCLKTDRAIAIRRRA